MSGDKAALRKKLRQTPFEADSASICRTILSSPLFGEAKIVMAYYPIPGEVDVRPVLQEILSSGKTLLLPRCEADFQMTARIIPDFSHLIPGPYGIPEPSPDWDIVPPEEIGLILVPALAFDRKGRRLGKGAGYYDRFLSKCTCTTVGVCGTLLEAVPTEAHDQSMDALATASEMIICRMEGNVCERRRKM